MSIEFKIKESSILSGVWIIKPNIADDLRGNIWTSCNHTVESILPEDLSFSHDKFSTSKKDVLRGIHGDNKSWKLVTCVYGKIEQVIVDCRINSKTFHKWEKFTIDAGSPLLILIPPNMGNSYLVKSRFAVYHYKLAYLGEYIDSDSQFTLRWDDPELDIDWSTKSPILSNRDQKKREHNEH
jgi:dTDP-4-dehydrorhamnose 3,5-epimerase